MIMQFLQKLQFDVQSTFYSCSQLKSKWHLGCMEVAVERIKGQRLKALKKRPEQRTNMELEEEEEEPFLVMVLR